MDTAAPSPSERLLAFAHQCISGALQFDYLSRGTSHRQSAPVRRTRASTSIRAEHYALGRNLVRRYLTEIATRKRLSSTEEYCLARSARNGDARARQRLIEHQLGLVVMLARRYRDPAVPLLDLIEEGNLGLMIAIEKFDPERGCRFSTYAKWWIRQSIDLALMTQANVVRVPVHLTRALKQQSRARLPASADSPRRNAGEPRLELRGTTRFLLHDVRNSVDAHQAARREELQTVLDTVPAPEHEQPDWHVQIISRRRHLESALLRLKETERQVLESRFGLANDVDHTLQDLAQQLGLSTERVRQIQAEALAKLRRILQDSHGVDSEGLL